MSFLSGSVGWGSRRLLASPLETLGVHSGADGGLGLRPDAATCSQPLDEAAVVRQQDADAMLRKAELCDESVNFRDETVCHG